MEKKYNNGRYTWKHWSFLWFSSCLQWRGGPGGHRWSQITKIILTYYCILCKIRKIIVRLYNFSFIFSFYLNVEMRFLNWQIWIWTKQDSHYVSLGHLFLWLLGSYLALAMLESVTLMVKSTTLLDHISFQSMILHLEELTNMCLSTLIKKT